MGTACEFSRPPLWFPSIKYIDNWFLWVFLVDFIHTFFPGIARHTAFELFYSELGQHTSVGGYWNDPHHHALYLNYSLFLPYIDNILSSVHSTEYKSGFSKLKKLILIGGPDDGVITPWQSRWVSMKLFQITWENKPNDKGKQWNYRVISYRLSQHQLRPSSIENDAHGIEKLLLKTQVNSTSSFA